MHSNLLSSVLRDYNVEIYRRIRSIIDDGSSSSSSPTVTDSSWHGYLILPHLVA